jgi:hypothetical protein
MKAVPYQEVVGTWPDIAFMVSQLAQFMENTGCVH